MITLTREEVEQLLDALNGGGWTVKDYAVELLRARLAQPEPEPVAWLHSCTGYGWQVVPEKLYPTDQPLYTSPSQREWQGLTDEEKNEITWGKTVYEILDLAEAKLKEKNTHDRPPR